MNNTFYPSKPITLPVSYFSKKDPRAIIPSYKSEKAAACDLYLIDDHIINANSTKIVPLGLIAIPPYGYHWNIYLRSSTGIRYPGLILSNCIGVIDSDYCGPEDELKLILRNTSNTNYQLASYERLAQMELVQNTRPDIRELDYEELQRRYRQSRGGLGSTGSR